MLRDDLLALMLRLTAQGRGKSFSADELAGLLRQPIGVTKAALARMQRDGVIWSNGSGGGADHQRRIFRLKKP